jgi:peptidoglycan/xylan/chitin deacetylase (PgdA/CDA1 family)
VLPSFSQQIHSRGTVAITVDDLPYAPGRPLSNDTAAEALTAAAINRKLLAAFRAHRVPVTGFVIGDRAQQLGPAGPRILTQWVHDGFDLGNHTWSHPEMNQLSVEEIEQEIVHAEPVIAPLMRAARKRLTFFRFPMNETGDTKEKHDAIADFLAQRGYKLAVCTIDTSDYVFNQAYVKMLGAGDEASARKLRQEYIAYSSAEIDYYARLNTQVFGYEPPEVMLLHDNPLNADVIEDVLKLFEERRYRFVTLNAAQSNPATERPTPTLQNSDGFGDTGGQWRGMSRSTDAWSLIRRNGLRITEERRRSDTRKAYYEPRLSRSGNVTPKLFPNFRRASDGPQGQEPH